MSKSVAQRTICLQCGDIGFANAFVYCVKCVKTAVHRYCLDVLPKTLDEIVHWTCDDCCQNKSKKNDTVAAKLEVVECAESSNKCCPEKTFEDNQNDSLMDSSREHSTKKRRRRLVKKSVKETEGLDCNEELHLKTGAAACTSLEGSTEQSNDLIEIRESGLAEERASACSHVDNTPADHSKDSAIASTVYRGYVPAEPVWDPIWRGSFDVWNKNEVIVGLLAHMSSRACQKAYEEANRFSPVLQLQVLPKSDVWPKSFETTEPNGEHIALYFFPSDLSSERVYNGLIDEMQSNELAMRAAVQNAELLVFTSTELQLAYWSKQSFGN